MKSLVSFLSVLMQKCSLQTKFLRGGFDLWITVKWVHVIKNFENHWFIWMLQVTQQTSWKKQVKGLCSIQWRIGAQRAALGSHRKCRPVYSLPHDDITISGGYLNKYFKQQGYSKFVCFQNKKWDNKTNNELTNMNVKKEERICHIYSIIFLPAQAQDL